MKKIILKNINTNDLCAVMQKILREKSAKLEFTEVLYIQKIVNAIKESVKDYSEKLDELNKNRDVYLKNANDKISSLRKKIIASIEDGKKLEEKDNTMIKDFMVEVSADVKSEIEKELEPLYKKLTDGLGKEKISFEIEESKLKMLISIFEKYAKEEYIDKSSMVETYEALMV